MYFKGMKLLMLVIIHCWYLGNSNSIESKVTDNPENTYHTILSFLLDNELKVYVPFFLFHAMKVVHFKIHFSFPGPKLFAKLLLMSIYCLAFPHFGSSLSQSLNLLLGM